MKEERLVKKKSSAGSYPDGSDTPVYVLNGYTKYHAVR